MSLQLIRSDSVDAGEDRGYYSVRLDHENICSGMCLKVYFPGSYNFFLTSNSILIYFTLCAFLCIKMFKWFSFKLSGTVEEGA